MTDNTDENNEVSIEQQLADKDAKFLDLQSQFDAIKNKSDELLSETKRAKQKARDAADAREQSKLEKAKKDGDFEQLLKSSEGERLALTEQLNSLKNNISSEKIKTHSMKMASDLADGSNAELLSEFISKRIKYTDDGIKVLDSHGALTVSSLDDLKNEFTSDAKYKSLLRGTKSTGGGASGTKSSGASGNSVKTIDRATFDTMTHMDRAAFFKDGGKIVDSL